MFTLLRGAFVIWNDVSGRQRSWTVFDLHPSFDALVTDLGKWPYPPWASDSFWAHLWCEMWKEAQKHPGIMATMVFVEKAAALWLHPPVCWFNVTIGQKTSTDWSDSLLWQMRRFWGFQRCHCSERVELSSPKPSQGMSWSSPWIHWVSQGTREEVIQVVPPLRGVRVRLQEERWDAVWEVLIKEDFIFINNGKSWCNSYADAHVGEAMSDHITVVKQLLDIWNAGL